MVNLRAILAAFKQESQNFLADPQWIIPSLVAPFTFSVVTLMLFPNKSSSLVLYAVLGGGILGMWSNSLRASGFSVNYDRMVGTLEPIMMTPTPLMEVVAGRAIWNSLLGLINAFLVFIIAELVFQTNVGLSDPLAFFLALVLTLLSLSAIGLALSAFFVFTRASSVLMQVLELPIYVVSGAMVPLSILPSWTWPIAYALPPSWGVDALQVSSGMASNNPANVGLIGDYLLIIATTLVFLGIALFLFKRMDRKARMNGSVGRW
jgi:ABC-2 type transport system permease protein